MTKEIKRVKKKLLMLTMLCMAALGTTGCGKEETETPVTTEAVTTEAVTEDPNEGKTYNELTGEWLEDFESKRPVAVMINNIQDALPSASTKQADIIYECMVEGGITRLMAIYSDYDKLEKIGSVRSARHYYINIANEYDAIYVHYGQSKPAKEKLDNGVINNINGLTYEDGFYRDSSRVAPHNAYTTGEKIVKGIENFKYNAEYDDLHKKVLSFNAEETDLTDGTDANTIHVNFSKYSQPYFVYNSEKKLYDRYEYNAPQIDELEDENDNILNFKNVIVLISSYTCINPENDLQELQQSGEGKGYYCTNGKAVPITWKKSSDSSKTEFYKEDGSELLLNPGKTWISIIGDGQNAGISFE